MAKYALKSRIGKIIELIDLVSKDLENKKLEDIGSYSLLARSTCFTVEQVCEHLISIQSSLEELSNQIPWKNIHSTRVFIAHIYDEIDMKQIYSIVKNDFPPLKELLLGLSK